MRERMHHGMQQILSTGIGLLIGCDLEIYYQVDDHFLIIRCFCFFNYLPRRAPGFPSGSLCVRAHIVSGGSMKWRKPSFHLRGKLGFCFYCHCLVNVWSRPGR